jgi:hypothetical protein
MTPNWGTYGVYNPHPIGVWYTGSQWAISNEDVAAMPLGVTFNVDSYYGNTNLTGDVTAAPGSNAFGDSVLINDLGINNPSAMLIVTPNWGTHGTYDPHPIGVWYTGSQWAVYHEDQTPIPAGASFNVVRIG